MHPARYKIKHETEHQFPLPQRLDMSYPHILLNLFNLFLLKKDYFTQLKFRLFITLWLLISGIKIEINYLLLNRIHRYHFLEWYTCKRELLFIYLYIIHLSLYYFIIFIQYCSTINWLNTLKGENFHWNINSAISP